MYSKVLPYQSYLWHSAMCQNSRWSLKFETLNTFFKLIFTVHKCSIKTYAKDFCKLVELLTTFVKSRRKLKLENQKNIYRIQFNKFYETNWNFQPGTKYMQTKWREKMAFKHYKYISNRLKLITVVLRKTVFEEILSKFVTFYLTYWLR